MFEVPNLLLSLSCPNRQLVQAIYDIVAEFLWIKNSPKFCMEIIEVEMKRGGGIKLHNI